MSKLQAINDLLKWICERWWRAGIAGFIVGTGATGCASLVISLLDKTGNGNLTFLIALVAYLPAAFVLSIGRFDQTQEHQALLAQFGVGLFITINGVILAVIFAVSVIVAKGIRRLNNTRTD